MQARYSQLVAALAGLASGAAVAQAIGPLRAAVATADGGSGKPVDQRYLVLIAIGSDQPVLQQQTL